MDANTRTKMVKTVPALLIAGAVKAWYSTANANDLLWLLAPTTRVAELFTGESFHYEEYMGYVNSDYSFLIAVPCAGVNFFITAFLLVALLKVCAPGPSRSAVHVLSLAAVIAYGATIIANALRIAFALTILRLQPDLHWLTPEQVHRLEGISVYFGCLLLLFALCRSKGPGPHDARHGILWVAFPLVIYWAVTLGVPLFNGAYAKGRPFWEHAFFVLFTPLILILPPTLYRYFSSRGRYQAL